MKNLDLNALGVVEMVDREMQETNGGFILALLELFAGAILVDAVLSGQESIDAIKDGMNSRKR